MASATATQDRSKIGGSDMAAILGVDGYGRTAIDVYLEKIGEAPSSTETEAMYWGAVLEDRVANRWAELAGERVRRSKPRDHPRHSWLRISPDRLVTGKPEGLEVKVSSADGWGEEGTDEIPLHMLPQVHTYIAATDAERWHVAALLWSFGPPRLQSHIVERDPEMVEIVLESGERFWRDHVERRVPPDPETSEAANRLWRRATLGKTVQATPDIYGALLDLEDLKAEQKALQARRDAIELAIKTQLQDAEACVDGSGAPLVTWKEQASRRFDSARFQAEHPDLYEKYRAETRYRVLRPKKVKA